VTSSSTVHPKGRVGQYKGNRSREEAKKRYVEIVDSVSVDGFEDKLVRVSRLRRSSPHSPLVPDVAPRWRVGNVKCWPAKQRGGWPRLDKNYLGISVVDGLLTPEDKNQRI
jgi:hypothetical protein